MTINDLFWMAALSALAMLVAASLINRAVQKKLSEFPWLWRLIVWAGCSVACFGVELALVFWLQGGRNGDDDLAGAPQKWQDEQKASATALDAMHKKWQASEGCQARLTELILKTAEGLVEKPPDRVWEAVDCSKQLFTNDRMVVRTDGTLVIIAASDPGGQWIEIRMRILAGDKKDQPRQFHIFAFPEVLRFKHGSPSELEVEGDQSETRRKTEMERKVRRVLRGFVAPPSRDRFMKIYVIGEHDVSGEDDDNIDLARKRADWVKRVILQEAKEYQDRDIKTGAHEQGFLRNTLMHQFIPGQTDYEPEQKALLAALDLKGADLGFAKDPAQFGQEIDLPNQEIEKMLTAGDHELGKDDFETYQDLVQPGRISGLFNAQEWWRGRMECEHTKPPKCDLVANVSDQARAMIVEENKRKWRRFRTVVLIGRLL